MADVNRGNRPLSPHLTVYRPQLTSVTSILTRITGNALLLGALLVVWWFLAAATGEGYFDVVNGILTSWFGDLVMFGLTNDSPIWSSFDPSFPTTKKRRSISELQQP